MSPTTTRSSFATATCTSTVWSLGNLPLPASGGNTAVRLSRANTGVINWTSVMGGALVNELRFAYNRLVGGIDTPTREQLWKDFGFLGLFDREDIKGLPVFRPSGYQNIGDRNFAPDPRKQDIRQLVESFSVTKGKHSLKMGTSIRNFIRWSGITNFARGRFDFNGQFTRAGGRCWRRGRLNGRCAAGSDQQHALQYTRKRSASRLCLMRPTFRTTGRLRRS